MIHRFSPFQYDSEQRLLFRNGERVALVPKAIDTLHVLLERRGRVVEKAELMKLVWPDTIVEDVGLARNISILRKALGDEGAESAYIETIPRRGYRFVDAPAPVPAPTPQRPVRLGDPDAAVAGEAPVPAPTRRRRWLPAACLGIIALISIAGFIYSQFYVPSRFLRRGADLTGLAVVPFESLTPEQNHSGFAQGFTDSLVATLSKLDGVQVVSPSTVRRHQRVGISMGLMGRLLGLEVLVEGAIRRVGDRLRITARLVDVHTGKVIWSENYDRPAGDPGQVETQVAAEVATQVGAHLALHGKFPATR